MLNQILYLSSVVSFLAGLIFCLLSFFAGPLGLGVSEEFVFLRLFSVAQRYVFNLGLMLFCVSIFLLSWTSLFRFLFSKINLAGRPFLERFQNHFLIKRIEKKLSFLDKTSFPSLRLMGILSLFKSKSTP